MATTSVALVARLARQTGHGLLPVAERQLTQTPSLEVLVGTCPRAINTRRICRARAAAIRGRAARTTSRFVAFLIAPVSAR